MKWEDDMRASIDIGIVYPGTIKLDDVYLNTKYEMVYEKYCQKQQVMKKREKVKMKQWVNPNC
jgi:hypothetical protein